MAFLLLKDIKIILIYYIIKIFNIININRTVAIKKKSLTGRNKILRFKLKDLREGKKILSKKDFKKKRFTCMNSKMPNKLRILCKGLLANSTHMGTFRL